MVKRIAPRVPVRTRSCFPLFGSRLLGDRGRLAEFSTQRLFVAIDPPDAVRSVLAELPEEIRGVAWTPPEQYHVTLRFIGEVAVLRVSDIEGALKKVSVESFLLPVEGVGAFPPGPRPPKIIWAGVGSGHPRLFQLRQRVDDALLATGLDIDVRTFEPHVTLGRCGRDSPVGQTSRFVRERAGFAGPMFRVDSFTLYQSELKPAGAVHTALLKIPLEGSGH